MYLVTLSEPLNVTFRKVSGGITQTLEANRTYVIADAQWRRMARDPMVEKCTYKLSKLDMRVQNFHISALKKGQRILLYNGSGGYGDQIMTWPFAKILSDAGAAVHVLTDPGNNLCWWNLPFARSVCTVPILWEQVQMYDHFLPFEVVVNTDDHPDQAHPLNVMLHKVGIDPDSIPVSAKKVKPVFTPLELGTLGKFLTFSREKNIKLGLYQMTSANPVRGLPAADSVFLITRLAAETPNIHWLCLYDDLVPKEYREKLTAEAERMKLTNVELFTAINLRELWALTEHVNVVVGPDSMMVHIAGSFGTPCVGLWGPVHPANRVCYYEQHYPVYHPENCPHSPCFVHTNVFPPYCPARPGTRAVCDVMASISPSEVISLVKAVAR